MWARGLHRLSAVLGYVVGPLPSAGGYFNGLQGRCPRRISNACAGFNLVEVALATGVVAIGLVGVLGLFPLGLRATRGATDDTQKALIAQDYIAYYQQLAFSTNNYSGSDLLQNGDYVSVVTQQSVLYSVHVVVTNSGFSQMTNGSLNLMSRVMIDIWRQGTRTNSYVTEVGRYVVP